MNFYDLLNTLILALSISTVLITLVAFMIYQIRRLHGSNLEKKHGYKLESVFFKRFAPHIEDLIRDWEAEQKASEKKKRTPYVLFKLTMLFGVLAMVVTTAFVLEGTGRKSVAAYTLQKRGERVSELQDKGMLKKYYLNPVVNTEAPAVLVSKMIEQQTLRSLSFLRGKKIILMTSRNLRKNKDSRHIGAVKAWTGFLNRNKIPYEVSSDSYKVSSYRKRKLDGVELFVLPQFTIVNDNLKEVISQFKGQAGVVFTGPVESATKESQWFKTLVGLEFKSNNNHGEYLASQFNAHHKSNLMMPPGQILPLVTTDNRFNAVSTDENPVLAFETDFIGIPKYTSNEWVVKAKRVGQTLWTAWDPVPLENSASPDKVKFANYIHIESLADLAGQSSARLSWWPEASPSRAVISVDSEGQFLNISSYLETFKKYEAPATLFLVSQIYEKNKNLLTPYMPNLELASHGDVHDSFGDQTVRLQFNRLQESRHTIEEAGGKIVTGFRPPYEEMDDNTLRALKANRFSYLFAGQDCLRLSPCILTSGLVMFPRVLLDDVALVKDRTLVSPENIYKAMAQNIDQVKKTGGAYFLSFHTQVFGQIPYRGVVDQIMKKIKEDKDIEFITFDNLATWWKTRDNIEVHYRTDELDQKYVEIVNSGESTAKNISVNFYNAKVKDKNARKLAQSSKTSCSLKKGLQICKLDQIRADERIELYYE